MVFPSTFIHFTSHISTILLPSPGWGFCSLYYNLPIFHTQYNFISLITQNPFPSSSPTSTNTVHVNPNITLNCTSNLPIIRFHYTILNYHHIIRPKKIKLHAKIACIPDSIASSLMPSHLPHRIPTCLPVHCSFVSTLATFPTPQFLLFANLHVHLTFTHH